MAGRGRGGQTAREQDSYKQRRSNSRCRFKPPRIREESSNQRSTIRRLLKEAKEDLSSLTQEVTVR